MRIAIIFVLAVMALLIEPLGNESTIVSYSVAVAVGTAGLAELEEVEDVVSSLCRERGFDEVVSFTTTKSTQLATKGTQISGMSCH